jgi:hypothetical protein
MACLVLPAGALADVAKPDLVADPPEKPRLEQYAVAGKPPRMLLRFDGHVHNAGAGALEIRRAPDSVVQRLFEPGAAGVFEDRLLGPDRVKYETTDGHDHFHLQRIARYSLWDAANTAEVAPAMKVGFCLLDSTKIAGSVARTYASNCEQGNPDAATVKMGVSSGWRDLYGSTLPFQWVDVTHTVPGAYRLHAEMDPEDFLAEADETNVPGETPVTLRGYVAGPRRAGFPSPGHSTPLSLSAGSFGTPGPREFRVEEAPAHGSVTRPAGEWVRELVPHLHPRRPGRSRRRPFRRVRP